MSDKKGNENLSANVAEIKELINSEFETLEVKLNTHIHTQIMQLLNF